MISETTRLFSRVAFETLSFPCFNYYRDLFYNGKKILPSNIEDLLTPRGLAFWIMDDGCRVKKGLVLYTNSFSMQEVELLMKDQRSSMCLKLLVKKR